MGKDPIDLNEIRARLAGTRGKQYWRSLEELAETTAFKEFLHREFPKGAAELNEPLSRRTFLKLMGASLALAGLGGCAAEPPREKIVPYVGQPDPAITPGKPLFFATAMPIGGYGLGLLAESHIGRPTKVEGNPIHPASLGATNAFAQASVLSLYDPDRAQAVTNLGQISTWETFTGILSGRMQQLQSSQGAGLRILTETITSPTLGAQIQALLQKLPQARWHQYDPAGDDNVREGARLAFGQYTNTVYNFAKADRVLALDANFLQELPGHLRYAREFIDRREVREGQADMNRLYVVESMPTITGAMADHRLPLRASQIEGFARAVAQALGIQAGTSEAPQGIPAGWIDAVVRDLQQRRGASIVIAGPGQPPAVHALAHAMNQALGNVGATVVYTEPVEVNPVNQLQSLRELATDMAAGTVDTLVIIESNPVFTAPADLNFADLIRKVPFTAHMSLYFDETAALSQWHVPQTHYLESWGDVRAFDGTVSIIQPLILPLYNGKSAYELLGALSGNAGQSSYDIVRAYWQGQGRTQGSAQQGDFEQFWRQSIHDGVVAGTAAAPIQVTLSSGNLPAQAASPQPQAALEIVFRPDSSVWDGRFANNAWLQELPRQLTTITWDNAAYISPATAQRLGYSNEDLVELRFDGRAVRAPIWIVPGHADDSVTLHMGYGRQRAGQVGTGVGANAYAIRTSGAPWFGSGLEVAGTGQRYSLSTTQEHFSVEGRDLVREGTLEQFRQNPNFARNEFDEFLPSGRPQQQAAAGGEEQNIPSLLPEWHYTGNAWGMAINLNACIGCNACTIACQAENNIPVVGKEQVGRSREMHWLKVDVYNSGGVDNPDTVFQPRPCMHCEKAPCELVCPVAATVHDAEGLNTMVYNRCIGTRYCSNNCPYKVRRFNFLTYNQDIPVINLVHNPDVTVRARGVMEKCTYCIQRIEEARITAERETRTIRDGEVLTACQQVCPTNAIVFGNINDPNSQVSQLKGQPLNYGMLAELGTQPRTTYLARLRNPNPELEAKG
jgi:molybdopterin-containing oxidoreductase family iron-sulfur binding subunit